MIEFIDKAPDRAGTPINRANLMGMQGFENGNITFPGDGTIVETYPDGKTVTVSFPDENTVSIKFVGEKTITKTIKYLPDGTISEVVS